MRRFINNFLNKKSDFTKSPQLASANDQFYYLLNEEKKLFNYILRENIKYFFKYKKLYLLKLILAWVGVFIMISGLTFGIIFSLNYLDVLSVSTEKNRDVVISYRIDSTMNLKNYLIQIAYTESRYIAKAHRNGSKYYGIFQIGRDERKLVGYGDISDDVFLNHDDIQILTMIKLLKYNKKIMQNYIDKYSGKIIDGILVTESGILALCQLGTGSTQNYLDSGYIPQVDEYGNRPRDLLKIGGYQLNLNNINCDVLSAINSVK